MKKQAFIAGLLAVIGAQDEDVVAVDEDDVVVAQDDDVVWVPPPCEDIITRAADAAGSYANSLLALEAWEGKIQGLELASMQDAGSFENAQESYTDAMNSVLPFYNAME